MVKRTKKKTKKPESSLKPRKIKVIGIGGGGASIVSEMAKGLWNKGIFLVFSVRRRRVSHLSRDEKIYTRIEGLSYPSLYISHLKIVSLFSGLSFIV